MGVEYDQVTVYLVQVVGGCAPGVVRGPDALDITMRIVLDVGLELVVAAAGAERLFHLE